MEVFDGEDVYKESILERSKRLLVVMQQALNTNAAICRNNTGIPMGVIRRCPPCANWIKLNMDGAVNSVNGKASCGDHNANGWKKVDGPTIVSRIHELCCQQWKVKFSHVRCNGNGVADRLSKLVQLYSFDLVPFIYSPRNPVIAAPR
ncbi:hypothetical protein V6N13_060128 [Hibiscus sabdariffa]